MRMRSRLTMPGIKKLSVIALVASMALAMVTILAGAAPASAAPRGAPGSSMRTAAASCWEIKQLVPDAPDGVYWLVTPQLQRPEQFFCEMTTDGGGWVLVGRGRQGWRAEYEGLGTAAEVRDVVNGPAAFRTRQLSSNVIDGLLGGGRVDALPDGIRLRRAVNTGGTTWQEVRFQLRQRDRWVWTFRGKHPIRSFAFDGVSSASSVTTYDFGSDTAARRVNTEITGEQSWNGGWAYGPGVRGLSSAQSYLWSAVDGRGKALPFTQMYLRPKLRTDQLTYPQVESAGLPAVAQRPLAQTKALKTVWGVAGLASNKGEDSELRSEVQALAQVGSRVYVGGNFKTVQRTEGGTAQVAQPYLAAFDVNTGEFISGFRPSFNNQIKTLVALPNGRLAVGGEFTRVNGAPSAPVVVLDAMTGLPDPGFSITMRNGDSATPAAVRSLKVGTTTTGGTTRSWLYVGGLFTHIVGGGQIGEAYTRSAGRVDATTGAPDKSWTPIMNGSVNDITPSKDGARVYLAGFFTLGNGVVMDNLGVLSTSAGATPIPWTPRYSVDPKGGKAYQWTVSESANRVWQGGSQHTFNSYDRATLAFSYGGIAMQGGDFQTSVVDGDVVYGGCHCIDYLYSGVTKYGWPSTFDQADKIGFVGAFDEATGRYLPEFDPIMVARGGYGAWASMVDSTGVLWIGGSFTKAINVQGVPQWSGGFVRFAPRDAQAPASPSGLSISGGLGEVSLRWSGIAEAGVDYEVLENGRVVAATSATSTVLEPPARPATYAVRAVDAAGNRSASTAPAPLDPSGITPVTTPVSWGSSWSWRYDATPFDPTWAEVAFDDSPWSQGPAPLGFGSSTIATPIHSGAAATRPVTAYFRRSFQVPDPGAVGEIVIDAIADDGVVVYLNGQEVGREQMGQGPITPTRYATATTASPLRVTVPAAALVAGKNVLAAETHLNYRSTRDIGFDARVVLTQATTP